MNQTPTSMLEAVNYLLMSVGEHRVNSLSDSRSAHVDNAQQIIHEASRDTQSIGLNCNREKEYPFTPDADGYVRLPQNLIRLAPSNNDKEWVRRGEFLYDKERHSFEFEDTVKLDVVWFLEFEKLPQVVRDYITKKAGRIFQTKVVGSESEYEFSLRDEQEAWARLKIEEIDGGQHNMLNRDSVRRKLRRR